MTTNQRLEQIAADAKVQKLAQHLALTWINRNRAADGKQLLSRLEKLWWTIHGAEWIAVAQKQIANEKQS